MGYWAKFYAGWDFTIFASSRNHLALAREVLRRLNVTVVVYGGLVEHKFERIALDKCAYDRKRPFSAEYRWISLHDYIWPFPAYRHRVT